MPDTGALVSFTSPTWPGPALLQPTASPEGASLGPGLGWDGTLGPLGSVDEELSEIGVSSPRPWCRSSGIQMGEEQRTGPVWCAVLFSPSLRACAWPCQLGEHLLHELPAAGPVCLPHVHQVAGRVHTSTLGVTRAHLTPVLIVDAVAPPEKGTRLEMERGLCAFSKQRKPRWQAKD